MGATSVRVATPVLLRNGHVRTVEASSPGIPLGITALSEGQYRVETFVFETGDILLLYTGGVIEAPDPHGTFYPLTKWIAAWDGAGGPEHLVRYVHEDLLNHTHGPLSDDAALIAIQRLP